MMSLLSIQAQNRLVSASTAGGSLQEFPHQPQRGLPGPLQKLQWMRTWLVWRAKCMSAGGSGAGEAQAHEHGFWFQSHSLMGVCVALQRVRACVVDYSEQEAKGSSARTGVSGRVWGGCSVRVPRHTTKGPPPFADPHCWQQSWKVRHPRSQYDVSPARRPPVCCCTSPRVGRRGEHSSSSCTNLKVGLCFRPIHPAQSICWAGVYLVHDGQHHWAAWVLQSKTQQTLMGYLTNSSFLPVSAPKLFWQTGLRERGPGPPPAIHAIEKFCHLISH